MLIKRFEGPSIQEVVRQVRAELGPDAIVLSQRSRPAERGWLGLRSGHVVEITAAVDRERLAAPSGPVPSQEEAPVRATCDDSWRPLQLTRALLEPLEDEIRTLQRAVHDPAPGASLAAEIEELRALVRELRSRPAPGADDETLAPFVRAGLDAEHASGLAADAALLERDGVDAHAARVQALADRLEGRLAAPRFDLGRHQLVVGAPGVGKTTTLAKLADRYRAQPPTVVSTDARRPGASARLRAAADELGIAYSEVVSPRELTRGTLGRGPVLIDTPGVVASSVRDLDDLRHLREELGRRADVQLVVSATTRQSDLERQLAACRVCEPGSLVVTRVDETPDLSNVVNLVLRPDAPRLAWLGCGPDVPDDLELPDAHALARRVLGAVA